MSRARLVLRAGRRPGAWLGLLVPLALAGCVGAGLPPPEPPPPPAAPNRAVTGEQTIGKGAVKIGMILPLTGPGQGAAAAVALSNAAELAVADFQNPELTLIIKDDRGTPEGAREAAAQAIADGAELIVGPLFAGPVQMAGQVARGAGRPVIAFSTDAAAATRGVYLLSFLPQPEVDRVVDYTAGQGRRSFAALIPESTYGNVVEAQFREAAARNGARVVAIERYGPGGAPAAIARLAPLIAGGAPQADALFLPETADGLPQIAQALTGIGFSPQRVRPFGTGVWNDQRVFRVAALQGGWFAAPDQTGFNAFAGRYRARFGAEPARIATLSYDAVSLAAALIRTQGSQRFTDPVLTNPSGFTGVDGTFRFKPDGTNERALAVLEIRNGAVATVSPAPRALGNSGT